MGLLSVTMSESILDFVVTELDARKGQWPEVAVGSGVPYRTVQKIGSRKTRSPRVDSVEKLATYFRENPSQVAA